MLLRGENEAELVVEVSANALPLEHRLGGEKRRAKAGNIECVGEFEHGGRRRVVASSIAHITGRNFEYEGADELDGKRHAVGHLHAHIWLASFDLVLGEEAPVAARSAC